MITRTLAENCLGTPLREVPEPVVTQAKKGLLNWMGVTIGASRHPSVEMVLELASELNVSGQASILGRCEKVDILWASLINGTSSHVFDFDDTHLKTIHHPSSPVAPVVFALGEWLNLAPVDLLRAYLLGCEAELRISQAVYPSHYRQGWHITSTVGVFGAAVAAGVLLGLEAEQMSCALGIAGTQASGLREMFGTMTKPFHPGKAAQSGLLAALLARKGFTSSLRVLEAENGFAQVLCPEHNLEEVNREWGSRWELLDNSFKPYACGVVLHPCIDACIALRAYAEPGAVRELEIVANPYVLELTGKENPTSGLEGKFSVYHAAAVAFCDGDASEKQFSDDKVADPNVKRLRKKVRIVPEESFREDEAFARLIRIDGSQQTQKIEHATGSAKNPMSTQALAKKFKTLTAGIIDGNNADTITNLVCRMDSLRDMKELLVCSKGSQNSW
jgi:2-methylcitrate dehydratase PrpD